jgi:hypothetical protein
VAYWIGGEIMDVPVTEYASSAIQENGCIGAGSGSTENSG